MAFKWHSSRRCCFSSSVKGEIWKKSSIRKVPPGLRALWQLSKSFARPGMDKHDEIRPEKGKNEAKNCENEGR